MLQLTDSEIFEDACENVCVIAFLPHISEGLSTRQQYLKVLDSVSETQRHQPFAFLWAEGTQQSQLESAVQVGGSGYPAAVVVSLKKQKFAPITAAFSAESINGFLRQLSKGAANLQPLQVPEIEVTPKWDGKGPLKASVSATLAMDDDELAALLADL